MKNIILAIIIIVLLIGIPITVYFAKQQQETRSRAEETCQPPAAVSNVKVNFPNCEGDVCNFEQASCTFDAVSGAVTYSLKVTEVDSGSVIKSETLSSATKIIFPVTNGKTYKCDVAAVNSCGQTGATGTDSKLCVIEGQLPTPSPTPTPTLTPVPTATPTLTPTPTPVPSGTPTPTVVVVTSTPIPTSPPIVILPSSTPTPIPTLIPGNTATTIGLGIGSAVIILGAIGLFLLVGL